MQKGSLLIVPFKLVQAPAERFEAYSNEQIQMGLKLYGYLLLTVVIWVLLTTCFRARSVTLPMVRLAAAAEKTAMEVLSTVMSSVAVFRGEASPQDDLPLIVLKG